MRLEINDDDFRALPKQTFRAAAYFLLHVIGDIDDEGHGAATLPASATSNAVPTGTTVIPPAPPAPPPPPATDLPPPPPPAVASSGSDDEGGSNIINFPTGVPVPPPPPGVVTAVTNVIPSTPDTSQGVRIAADASVVASANTGPLDTAGMPWDERIHQSGKGTKKNGEWKLRKLFNATPEKEAEFDALIQLVTREHAARKAGAAAAVAPPVQLPAAGNSVPVPPVPPAAPVTDVPPQANGGAPVPVPPAPPVGGVGSSDATPYRKLIDKITDLTRASKLQPAKVLEICQSHGAPSLMALNSMPHLIENVGKDIDAAALGLL